MLSTLAADILAVIGTFAWRTLLPSRFGSLGRSMFMVFELITLDDWFLVYEVLEKKKKIARICVNLRMVAGRSRKQSSDDFLSDDDYYIPHLHFRELVRGCDCEQHAECRETLHSTATKR